MRMFKCILVADDSITLRAERVVGKKIDFNEVLNVLYREGQKMSWHDDGEPGMCCRRHELTSRPRSSRCWHESRV
jgi:hypothetical protein